MKKYYVQRNTEYFDGNRWQVKREKVSQTFDDEWMAIAWRNNHAEPKGKAHIHFEIVSFWVADPKPLCVKAESNRHYQAFGGNYGYSESRIYESVREYYRSENWG